MIRLAMAIMVASNVLWAEYVIESVQFQDAESSRIIIEGSGKMQEIPKPTIDHNSIEWRLPSAALSETLGAKVDHVAPSALLQRYTIYPIQPKGVAVKILVNGDEKGLVDRTKLVATGNRIQLDVKYPTIPNATLALLSEEHKPLALGASDGAVMEKRSWSGMIWGIAVAVLAISGIVAVGYRVLKKKGATKGTRKYLVEALSVCPVGTKSSVALVKVGTDFILVGVSPTQVNFLANLDKLSEEYSQEFQYERSAFKQAVQDEFKKIRGPIPSV